MGAWSQLHQTWQEHIRIHTKFVSDLGYLAAFSNADVLKLLRML